MTQIDVLRLLKPLRYATAVLIAVGGIMHLLGLVTALYHGWPLPWFIWAFFLFAILFYPASALMILKNWAWGYWIAAVPPIIGGFFIFIGLFLPRTGFLMLLAGTVTTQLTWMGFVQMTSEAMAVAYAWFLICHRVWRLN